MRSRYYYYRRRHKHHFLKLIFILLLAFIAFIGYKSYSNIHKQANTLEKVSLNKKPLKNKNNLNNKIMQNKPITLMLLGIDNGALKRGKTQGRSDTIMLLHINPQTKKAVLISVPRDMGVLLPGQNSNGLAKINTAYPIGGVNMLANILQHNFGINIDGYVTINMGGITALLHEIGGVHVKSNLTFDQDWYNFKKGKMYHLHGKKALAYIRERHQDPMGDYGRQRRQRQLIHAILRKADNKTFLLHHARNFTVKGLAPHLKSDMSSKALAPFMKNYLPLIKHAKQTYIKGQSFMSNNSRYGQMEVERVSEPEKVHIKRLLK